MNSNRTLSRRTLLKGAIAGGGAMWLSRPEQALSRGLGPSTTVPPYVLPSMGGVEVTAILTTGEAADNGYRMVGIPDGLGALAGADTNANTFTLLMNHELTGTTGIPRAHGRPGAFVSKWTIDRKTLQVVAGQDLTPSPNFVQQWDTGAKAYFNSTTTWERLCSADLPDEKALRFQNLGTTERIFFDGEEVNFGRAWARIATGSHAGEAWELPRLGKMAFENVVACPAGKEKTIVALFDDGSINTAAPAASNPSEVFIYVGTKQSTGIEIERAGLTNGKLYGVRVSRGNTVVPEESDQFGLGSSTAGYAGAGNFELVELGAAGDVSDLSGLQLEQDCISKNIFRMQRPEDGAWDPRAERGNNLYFVTTANINPLLNSRLWHLQFKDLAHPELGGKIEILLTNTPGRMFDNIAIDKLGRILIQEDTGNNPYVSKIRLYGIDSRAFLEIATHDPALFQPGIDPARFITQDEESSGIIDAAHILGPGWFLFDVQSHLTVPADPELVEGGQLLAMYVDPQIGV